MMQINDEIITDERLEMQKIRTVVKKELKKYRKLKEIAMESVEYITLNRNLETSGGGGGDSKLLENAIGRKIDAERYCEKIEKILKKLEPIFRNILVASFIEEESDTKIYMDLDISERSYYYKKSEAIIKFYNIWLIKDVFLN